MTDHPAVHYALRIYTVAANRGLKNMESGPEDMTRKGTGTVYRIVVRDDIGERFALAFEGMEVEARGGQTVLTGVIIDQPHLHDILARISGLGLKLLSVESLPGEPYDNESSCPPTTDRAP
jgi:outer membrane PBP1 activator LpoA protein